MSSHQPARPETARPEGSAWRTLVRSAADALWPPRCWLCGLDAPRGDACAEHELPRAPAGPRCARCSAALPAVLADGSTCRACRLRPPRFQSSLVLGDYRGGEPLREWILALKHGHRRDLARVLGAALAERVRASSVSEGGPPLGLGWIVPVPLHPWRTLERGYDQAALLAAALADGTGVELQRALRRVRATLPQGEPGAVSRRANVEGAFRLRGRHRKGIQGRWIWLVDDVLTSGATASACAAVLRRAGAGEVRVVALGRAAPDPDRSESG